MIINNLIIVLKFSANISNEKSNLDRNQSHTGWNRFMTINKNPGLGFIKIPGETLNIWNAQNYATLSHLKKTVCV